MSLFLRGRHCHKVYSGEFLLPVTLPWVMSPSWQGAWAVLFFKLHLWGLITYFVCHTLFFQLKWLMLCMQISELTLPVPMPYFSYFDFSKATLHSQKKTKQKTGLAGGNEHFYLLVKEVFLRNMGVMQYKSGWFGFYFLFYFLFLSMQQDWVNSSSLSTVVLLCSVNFGYGILKRDKHRQWS